MRFLTFLLILGCGSKFFTNAKAYFNTFYNLRSYFLKAENFYKQGLMVQARPLYMKVQEKASRIILLHPKSDYVDDALYMLAVSYARLRDHANAQERFLEFIKYFPESPLLGKVYLEYGRMLLEKGEYEQAINFLKLAMERIRDEKLRYEVLFLLANAYYHTSNYTFAKAMLDSIDFERIHDRKMILEASKLYMELNFPEKAIELMDIHARRIYGNDTLRRQAILLLYQLYKRTGDFNRAYETINSIELNDSTPFFYYVMYEKASILLLMGDTSYAMEILQMISDRSKDTMRFHAYYLLGLLNEKKGRYDEAIELYEKAYAGGVEKAQARKSTALKLKEAKDKDDPEQLYSIAEILLNDGRYSETAFIVDRLLSMEDMDASLRKKVLMMCIYLHGKLLGNKERSGKCLNEFKLRFSDSTFLSILESWHGDQ